MLPIQEMDLKIIRLIQSGWQKFLYHWQWNMVAKQFVL